MAHKFFIHFFQNIFWNTHKRLVVLDDFFPTLLSGFRVAEYNAYLEIYPDLEVLSTVKNFSERHAQYAELYPAYARRIRPFSPYKLRNCSVAYINFLNNAAHFLKYLECYQVPFVLTLYPGGGLGLNDANSNRKLMKVLSSPLLRSLIVTQPIIEEYVRQFVQQHRLKLPPIKLVQGVVAHPMYFDGASVQHGSYFGMDKSQFDICFVAEKYMPQGANKGYPEFIAMVRKLVSEPDLCFHVVGGFSPQDLDVSGLEGRLHFHGQLETRKLQQFFSAMDLIVSPNRPFVLHSGNFDGFPTGCCVEASLSGVAVMASDELKQNPGYINGESMIIVPVDADVLAHRVRELLQNPQRVSAIAQTGRALTQQWYAPSVQIGARLAAIEALANVS